MDPEAKAYVFKELCYQVIEEYILYHRVCYQGVYFIPQSTGEGPGKKAGT